MQYAHGFTHILRLRPSNSLPLLLVVATLIAALDLSFGPKTLAARLQTQKREPQLLEPELPATPFVYNDAAALRIIQTNARLAAGNVAGRPPRGVGDNTPASNPVTDNGATLGRVLFYDTRLSANNTTSCGSCHMQEFGFSDTARFSVGLNGGRTKRHSMALGNARFYTNGRFFWDERAATLEEQVLMPIQDSVEMGMKLDALVTKLGGTKFYPALFQAVFGTPEVNSERISLALAQFIRALVSTRGGGGSIEIRSPLGPPVTDSALFQARVGAALALRVATAPMDVQGPVLFQQQCATCHVQSTHSIDGAHNTGLDSVVTDEGAGGGKFKAPSLRNVAVRGPYMHDGRFKTLLEVVEFYNSGIKNTPNLEPMFRRADGSPDKMNLTDAQKASLVAYMQTFTDPGFLRDQRFSDPFRRK